MEKYICEHCSKESKLQITWADQIAIDGDLYFIKTSKCEHCNKTTDVEKVKLT